MNNLAQNSLNAPLFEIPDPPEEFGQDGGKFYRCYDTLADEVDEDMVKGLKEQLDGMLIFAGLFAGVNTAFLALTLPLLSADPADDTNALLSLNNAILIQLLAGRNDSVPANSPLPSASFSPSSNIFIINALFALSLAFAIISSFLAVLGRQWLVYYRKRGGGGPERQRWEQLRRFLGAERWRFEAILDDVLPSLLQIGLIIFCVSFILYLRHLNYTVSVIVGIPIPLSHMFLGLLSALINKRYLLTRSREEESLESLQLITLRRAVCTSDDPAILLHATSNIMGITNPAQMVQLWSDEVFQERFRNQYRQSYSRVLFLRGRDQVGIAAAAKRVYSAAALHLALALNVSQIKLPAVQDMLIDSRTLIPDEQLSRGLTTLIRIGLRFPILRPDRCNWQDDALNDLGVQFIEGRFEGFHLSWVSLVVIAWFSSNLQMVQSFDRASQESMQQEYESDAVGSLIRTLGIGLRILVQPGCQGIVDCHGVLMMLLYAIHRIVGDQAHSGITLRQKFALLEICEHVLHSPRLSETARQAIRKIRRDLAHAWQQEVMRRARSYHIPAWLVAMLEQYHEKIVIIYPPGLGYHEYLEVLRAFDSPIRKLFSYSPRYWASRSGFKTRAAFREAFNTFVLHIDNMTRQAQNNVLPSVRAPEERWCHWQEETLSVRANFSLPADPSDSWWHGIQELPEIGRRTRT